MAGFFFLSQVEGPKKNVLMTERDLLFYKRKQLVTTLPHCIFIVLTQSLSFRVFDLLSVREKWEKLFIRCIISPVDEWLQVHHYLMSRSELERRSDLTESKVNWAPNADLHCTLHAQTHTHTQQTRQWKQIICDGNVIYCTTAEVTKSKWMVYVLSQFYWGWVH